MPPLLSPHLGKYSIAFRIIGIDFAGGENHLWGKIRIFPQAVDGFNQVAISDCECVLWHVFKPQIPSLPGSSLFRNSIKLLVEGSHVVVGQAQLFYNLKTATSESVKSGKSSHPL
jgi:hypothetical protein